MHTEATRVATGNFVFASVAIGSRVCPHCWSRHATPASHMAEQIGSALSHETAEETTRRICFQVMLCIQCMCPSAPSKGTMLLGCSTNRSDRRPDG